MGTTKNIFKWVFQNIAPGETDPEKRVDADRVMDNAKDLRDMVGVVEARGANATDGNRNGQSTPTQCNLTLKTARGQLGLLELNDFAHIYDGVNKWYLVNGVGDDELSFSDADLAEGDGPPDYAAPAFIASLIIHVVKVRPKVGKNDLILAGGHQDKLTGDDIEAAADDVTPLGGKLGDLKDRVDVSLDESGNIKTEAVAGGQLAKGAFLDEDFQNVIWGQLDADFDNDGLANNWLKFNTPTCEMDESIRKVGQRTQKVIASQPQDGVYTFPFPPVTFNDYLGDYVAFSAWVRAGDDASVVLEIYDGVKTTTGAAGGAAGAWVRLGLEHQVDAAATTLEFRVYADRATTFHVDGAMAKRGRLHPGYATHNVEIMRTFMAGEDYVNAVLNGDFAEWTNGDDELPDFWRTGGDFNPPTAVVRETANVLFGASALRLTLALGEGVYYDVPNYAEFRNGDAYLCAYFLGVSGANNIRLQIDDGFNVEYVDFAPDAAAWQRPGHPIRVAVQATRLRLSISNNDAGTVIFVCDGAMVTHGQFPLAFTRSSQAKPFKWDFVMSGPVAAGRMLHEGAALDVFPVPGDCVVHKILAYEGTAPAAGTDTFAVLQNGVPTVLAAEVATGQNAGAAHEPVLFQKGDRVQVTVMPGVAPGADAGVVVEGYRWGY